MVAMNDANIITTWQIGLKRYFGLGGALDPRAVQASLHPAALLCHRQGRTEEYYSLKEVQGECRQKCSVPGRSAGEFPGQDSPPATKRAMSGE